MSDTRTDLRARDRRFPIEPSSRTRIEFDHPAGERRRMPIVDISVAGLSFVSEGHVPGLDPGTRIEGVTVHIGDCRMTGRLQLRHVDERGDWTWVYGGMFYPDDENDVLKLNGVIAALGACRVRG